MRDMPRSVRAAPLRPPDTEVWHRGAEHRRGRAWTITKQQVSDPDRPRRGDDVDVPAVGLGRVGPGRAPGSGCRGVRPWARGAARLSGPAAGAAGATAGAAGAGDRTAGSA